MLCSVELLVNTEIKIVCKEADVTNFEVILDICDEILKIPRETSVTCAAGCRTADILTGLFLPALHFGMLSCQ
jgi:hypothetical protein